MTVPPRRTGWWWCGILLSTVMVASLSGCIVNPSGVGAATINARQGVQAATSAVVQDGSLPTDPTAWLAAFHTNGGAGANPRLIDGTSATFTWSLSGEPVVFRTATRGTTAVLDVISAGTGYEQLEPVQVFACVCARIVVDPGGDLAARASDLRCPRDIVAAARLQTATAVTLDGTPSATWTPRPPVSPPGG